VVNQLTVGTFSIFRTLMDCIFDLPYGKFSNAKLKAYLIIGLFENLDQWGPDYSVSVFHLCLSLARVENTRTNVCYLNLDFC